MPREPLAESEYLEMLNLIDTEIENTFVIFHTYEELNRLALNDSAIFAVLNADALFWQAYRSTLLTSLFMTMSRLFDPVSQTITVQSVVTATLGNLQLFSDASLRARKTGTGSTPPWLDEYMKTAWIPTEASQLRHLQKALNPHVSLFQSAYLPIRNDVYAHRFMSDDEAGVTLFPRTNREELGTTIDFLQDLIFAIQNLYLNGREPKLSQYDPKDKAQRIREGAEKVLRKLANAMKQAGV